MYGIQKTKISKEKKFLNFHSKLFIINPYFQNKKKNLQWRLFVGPVLSLAIWQLLYLIATPLFIITFCFSVGVSRCHSPPRSGPTNCHMTQQ